MNCILTALLSARIADLTTIVRPFCQYHSAPVLCIQLKHGFQPVPLQPPHLKPPIPKQVVQDIEEPQHAVQRRPVPDVADLLREPRTSTCDTTLPVPLHCTHGMVGVPSQAVQTKIPCPKQP